MGGNGEAGFQFEGEEMVERWQFEGIAEAEGGEGGGGECYAYGDGVKFARRRKQGWV